MLLQHMFSTVFVAVTYQKNYVFAANILSLWLLLANVGCRFCLEVAAFICLLKPKYL